MRGGAGWSGLSKRCLQSSTIVLHTLEMVSSHLSIVRDRGLQLLVVAGDSEPRMFRGWSGADAGWSGVERPVQTLPPVINNTPAYFGDGGIRS